MFDRTDRLQAPLPTLPFVHPVFFYPENYGQQFRADGAGGPRNGCPTRPMPWPYRSGFINFIFGYPYGAASTAIQPRPIPYNTGYPAFQPIGVMKVATGSGMSF